MSKKVRTIEDELLILEIQDGNKAALNEIVYRWNKRVWLYAYRIVSDYCAADDIAQESWLAIVKGLTSLQDVSSYRTWIYRVTTNKSIDWIKKKKKDKHISDISNLEIIEQEKQQHGEIYELLDRLDRKKRIVVLLFYFENMGVNAIAKTLRIPAGTVKSRLSTARNELKKIVLNNK